MSLSQHTMTTLWLPLAMLAVLVLGSLWWWWRSHQVAAEAAPFSGLAQSATPGVLVDTPGALLPQAALVLGTSERKAYRLLRESFPRAEVLAHVQLLRFIRLPPREQREPWMQGTGMLDVDLLLCDGRFRVLAAVDVQTRRDTPAGKKRSERMTRVLEAAGIPVLVWHAETLPTVAEIRRTLAPMLAERKARARALEAAMAQGAPAPADADAQDSQPPELAPAQPPTISPTAMVAAAAADIKASAAMVRPPLDYAGYPRAAAVGHLRNG